MNRIAVLLIGILCISSCSQDNSVGNGWDLLRRSKNVSNAEFLNWWQENKGDYTKEQIISNLKYSLVYIPSELFLIRDKSSRSSDRSTNSDYNQDLTFLLTIENLDSTSNGSMLSVYGLMDPKKMKYWQFEFGNDINCKTSGNKYPAALCHMEPAFNLTNKLTFMISFPIQQDQCGGEIKIEIDDTASNTGRFDLIFDKNLIESIPGLI
jgi:hypothetical protein